LKASFQWNISEVVWQIEQNVKEFKDMIKINYASLNPSFAEMRSLARKAYENGRITDAVVYQNAQYNALLKNTDTAISLL
jgi:hypothetical protein